MGLADTVTKAYMKDNSVFADAFNYLIYGGEAVVDPKQLQELDTTEIALPFGSQDEEGKQPEEAVQKYRDVLKSLNRMMRLRTFYWESKIRLTFIMQCLSATSSMMLSSTENRWLILQPSIVRVMEMQKGIAVASIFLDSTKKIRLHLLSRWCCTLAQMNGMGRCHSMR